jgi:hypothetical protein
MMARAVAALEKTGVLVIRAWLEAGVEENALRARITRTLDVAAPETIESAAASAEEILAAVQEWLRSFTGSSVTAG